MIKKYNFSNKLSIGTAQLGNKYGITNTSGKVSFYEAKSILRDAYKKGVNSLDTAASYGESEYQLGKIGVKNWNISTKLPAIPKNCSNLEHWVNNIFQNSLNLLKLKKINTLLLHNPNDLLGNNSQNLYRIIQQGYITRKFYGENAAKESVVVSETVEKSEKIDTKKQTTVEKKKLKTTVNETSSLKAKSKRTTAGNNENNSHSVKEKPVKSVKKQKNKESKSTSSSVKKPANTGRITPSGTNVPRSQKKRKKKKRK